MCRDVWEDFYMDTRKNARIPLKRGNFERETVKKSDGIQINVI